MDIELMRRLSPRVNVIPVIGRADSLTPNELRAFKKRVCDFTLYPSLTLRNATDLGPSVGDGRYRILRYPRLQFPLR